MSDELHWLHSWFAVNGNTGHGAAPPPADTDYHAAGLLDSLGIVGLVADIELEFGFSFRHRDFQDRRFRTLAGLAEMIRERAGE